MGTAGKVLVLTKFSSKRERMLGVISENIEVLSDDDNDVFEKWSTIKAISYSLDSSC